MTKTRLIVPAARRLVAALTGLARPPAAVFALILLLPGFATSLAANGASAPGVAGLEAGFVHAQGNALFRGSHQITLKSVSFSNFYAYAIGENGFHPDTSPHHAENDFLRVRALGFNSVRFAFNGNWHEADPEGFFRWLDKNVAWAEKHAVLLTLDLHVPIGGYWLAANGHDTDFSLWTDDDLRQKNIELWQEIAARYRDRPIIAGFELLNEAVTVDETGDQYRSLVDDMIEAIRAVDANHMLIVGALYGTEKKYTAMSGSDQFLVDDDNVMYDFHFYEPIDFTHQNASWLSRPISDGGRYPDPGKLIPSGHEQFIDEDSVVTASLPPGTTDWTTYRSDLVRLDNPQAVAGLPVLLVNGDIRGVVNFDDVIVLEWDPETGNVTTLVNDSLTDESIQQWWPWEYDDYRGDTADFVRSRQSGAGDRASLAIDRADPDQPYWGWSSAENWFPVKPGRSYKIIGKMQGTDIAYPGNDPEAYAALQIDFYAEPGNSRRPAFFRRDKAYLAHELSKMLDFGKTHNVPMSVMEFGAMSHVIEDPDKGGAAWISDLIDLFEADNLSFSYWNYHGSKMGLYLSDFPAGPNAPNRALIDVLRRALGTP